MRRPGIGGRGKVSPLYRWLLDHWDAVECRESWAGIAARAAAEGIADATGQPPSPARCRRTWYQIGQARQREFQRQQRDKRRLRRQQAAAPAPEPAHQGPAWDALLDRIERIAANAEAALARAKRR